MRTRIYGVTAVLALAASTALASVAPGDLVVLQSIGDGTGTSIVAETSVPVSLSEFSLTPNALPVQTIGIPTTGASRLTIGALTGTEGLLTYNDGYIALAGYDADPGTPAVFRTAANAVRRMIGYNINQDLATDPQFNATTTSFNNGNFRSAIYSSAAGGAFGVGALAGMVFQPNGGSGAGTNIVKSGSGVASYGVEIFNGTLYYTIQSGTRGIYTIPGLPTTTGNTPTLFAGTPAATNSGTAVSGYNFWISPDGNTAYVAEDTDTASAANGGLPTGGVKKYTRPAGGAFSLAYTISTDYDGAGSALTGARSISVDNSGSSPILYVTTSDRQKLLSLTDTGTADGSLATLSILQTATPGNAIRSVAFISHLPGDTNDSGAVTGDDYALIDKGFARYAAGAIAAGAAVWLDGDYNHDGSVDSADYLVIDRAYATATGQLEPSLLNQRLAQFGQPYVDSLIASVPEPTSLLAACGLAAALTPRRRRHHS